MEKIYILLVEDQREVLQAVSKDLAYFERAFVIEECESATEAMSIMESIDRKGDFVALIISDHVMPEISGVDFLIGVNKNDRFKETRKVLLTGLATHQDTIRAINDAAIDQYIEKPWKSEVLVASVKKWLTEFILLKGIDYQPYIEFLDPELLFENLKRYSGSL